jgi:multiple sugar transport system permease protein
MYQMRLPPWLVLLLPAFVILLAVVAIPLVLSLYSSFTAFQLTRPETITRWIGTFNYGKAMGDANFWAAFGRTVLLLTLALNLEMLLGLGLAVMVAKVTHGQRLLRTMMMFPMMFSPILVGFQFKFIFNDNVGLLNNALQSLGLTDVAIPWLVDGNLAFLAIVAAEVWTSTSVFAILILAGRGGAGGWLYALADLPLCDTAVPDALHLYRDGDPVAGRGSGL